MTREEFIDWLDDVLEHEIPENHEEFTKKQLADHLFSRLFERMDQKGLVPK